MRQCAVAQQVDWWVINWMVLKGSASDVIESICLHLAEKTEEKHEKSGWGWSVSLAWLKTGTSRSQALPLYTTISL